MSAFDPKADIGCPATWAWPWIFDPNQVHRLALQTIVNGALGRKFAGRESGTRVEPLAIPALLFIQFSRNALRGAVPQ
jgi:hypothetical protein